MFAQIVASRFAHANAVGKVSYRIRHPKQPVCVELNYEHFIHYHQHLDWLHKVRNVILNYENFRYVLSEGNNVRKWAKTQTNLEHNTYNEIEKHKFYVFGRNNSILLYFLFYELGCN